MILKKLHVQYLFGMGQCIIGYNNNENNNNNEVHYFVRPEILQLCNNDNNNNVFIDILVESENDMIELYNAMIPDNTNSDLVKQWITISFFDESWVQSNNLDPNTKRIEFDYQSDVLDFCTEIIEIYNRYDDIH